jgi:hypothetical protein
MGPGMDSTNGVWIPAAAIFCLSTTSSRLAITSNQPPMQRVLALLSEIDFSDREDNHLLPQHDRHESTSTSPIRYRFTLMIPFMPEGYDTNIMQCCDVCLNVIRYGKTSGEVKVHPRTGHEGPDGSRDIVLLFL